MNWRRCLPALKRWMQHLDPLNCKQISKFFSPYLTAADDGWSGTNFERPDFQRMMDDVEAGKVNCIVTKDLSRFGREHVMMDYYLEFLFPEKRVRYIAVAENEDTEKGLSDFVPFKNLFKNISHSGKVSNGFSLFGRF